jgi:nicotinamide mononucleotide transporter
MNQIFNFFLDPYKSATVFDISLEIIGALFGVISVLFAKGEHILVFPTGLVSTSIYIFVCFQYALYGDLIINIYYTIMSIYGWYVWSKIVDGNHIPITKCSQKDWIKVGSIFAFTSILVIVIYLYTGKFNQATDYFDTLTTGIFFAGMWLMANKKLENWTFWIVGNLISVPLYFVKGLGFSGIQFIIFLFLAYQGHQAWKKILDKKSQIS